MLTIPPIILRAQIMLIWGITQELQYSLKVIQMLRVGFFCIYGAIKKIRRGTTMRSHFEILFFDVWYFNVLHHGMVPQILLSK